MTIDTAIALNAIAVCVALLAWLLPRRPRWRRGAAPTGWVVGAAVR